MTAALPTVSPERKTVLPALLVALLAWAPASVAQPPVDAATAINMAGRQRMLSQRIVRLHVQIGMGVARETAREQLGESLARLALQTIELGPSATTPALRDAIARLHRTRPPLQSLALATPTKEGAFRLDEAAEEVLLSADELTSNLESGAELGSLVNVAGRQRMLSQRLAKLYLLNAWGVAVPDLARKADAARAQFEAALGRLMREGSNTAEIDRELYAIAVQWEWFKTALALQDVASYALVVCDASDSMLRSLERVVALYERASAR